jgi:hypothetical protein
MRANVLSLECHPLNLPITIYRPNNTSDISTISTLADLSWNLQMILWRYLLASEDDVSAFYRRPATLLP